MIKKGLKKKKEGFNIMKKKKKEGFLERGYKDSWEYILQSKNFILFSVFLFFIFALVGFFFPTPEVISKEILRLISEIVDKTEGFSTIQMVFFIFNNNVSAAFFGIILGILLGIYPFFSSVFNGYVLGFVGKVVSFEEGLSILWKLLPHGIFELPAIFLSFGLGMKLGTVFFRKDIKKNIKTYFLKSLEVFVFIVLPLLFLAAIIEGSLIGFLG
jgi:stage II sporulation protein M